MKFAFLEVDTLTTRPMRWCFVEDFVFIQQGTTRCPTSLSTEQGNCSPDNGSPMNPIILHMCFQREMVVKNKRRKIVHAAYQDINRVCVSLMNCIILLVYF